MTVQRKQLTMRQLLAKLAGARGHFVIAGTPEPVADVLEDWVDSGAADEQIAFALRQADGGTAVGEICRRMGVADWGRSSQSPQV